MIHSNYIPMSPSMFSLRPNFVRRWAGWGMLSLLLLFLPAIASTAEIGDQQPKKTEEPESYQRMTDYLGSWIWDKETHNDQICRFWRSFEIPSGGRIAKARVVMTADNDFTLFLDGRELGRGVEWREWYVFDLTTLLPPGRHVLAVSCYNGAFAAGMLFGMRIELADGRIVDLKSDRSWRIVPEEASGWAKRREPATDWESATVIAPFGGAPWDKTIPEAVIMMPIPQPIKVLFWQTGWFQFSLSLLCFVATAVSLWLLAQLVFHRKERQIVQQERIRIARDIHDDMGGRLTQLVVHVEVARNELPSESKMRPELSWVCGEIRGLLSTMDEVLWVVNPRCDTLAEFADYVCNYAQEFFKATQVQCFFAVDSRMPAKSFAFPLRRSLLMAVKEALNNALKHSGATELHLKIHWQEPRLIVVIQDNGKGFDLNSLESRRNGLTNMAQRLDELGGNCRITSAPGAGCRVELELPLKRFMSSSWWNWKTNPDKTNLL